MPIRPAGSPLKTPGPFLHGLLSLFCLLLLCGASPAADDGYQLWLKYRAVTDTARLSEYRRRISSLRVAGDSETCRVVREELVRGLGGMLGPVPMVNAAGGASLLVGTPAAAPALRSHSAELQGLGDEGYLLKSVDRDGRPGLILAANTDAGLLYGAFHLLRLIQTGEGLEGLETVSKPRIRFRLLNHWDNLDGSVERGYAGRSLWKWDELPAKIDPRYVDYARANASIGINGAVLNNVNANPAILKPEYLAKVAKLADVFRPYRIRVFLSVNFASPISAKFDVDGNRRGGVGDLDTTDPLSPDIRAWWKAKSDEIYRLIPDFGGFLVKASSEGMPGPQDSGRTHAEGANMLAEALRPHGGVVMWRAFVYSPESDPDRAKRAYKEFVPLDGLFAPNVFVQAKNGPIDFQPREPVQPLFAALPRTPKILELQITQEYLGHSTHLVYLAPMWHEYLEFDTRVRGEGATLARIIDGSLEGRGMTGIAGVANIGSDRNWCGHLFGQANWYAFGRLAWNPSATPESVAGAWIRMTLGDDPTVLKTVRSIMLRSWEACVNYMTPLGLHHIMQKGFHYGPQPDNDEGRPDWTSIYYHRADSAGLGFDRSPSGSDAVSQYPPPLRERFGKLGTCPEKYLLWFHHVVWEHRMKSGRTLWEELVHRYRLGVREVDRMADEWNSLESKVDPGLFAQVQAKLARQRNDAAEWRDVCLRYFQAKSGRPLPPE